MKYSSNILCEIWHKFSENDNIALSDIKLTFAHDLTVSQRCQPSLTSLSLFLISTSTATYFPTTLPGKRKKTGSLCYAICEQTHVCRCIIHIDKSKCRRVKQNHTVGYMHRSTLVVMNKCGKYSAVTITLTTLLDYYAITLCYLGHFTH